MYLSLLGDGISSHGTKYMENPDFELNFIILDIKSNDIYMYIQILRFACVWTILPMDSSTPLYCCKNQF